METNKNLVQISMNSKIHYIVFGLILLAGVILRVHVSLNTWIPVADSGEYLEIAANLARGTGYQLSTWWTYYGTLPEHPLHPDASRQPLYPILVGFLFKVFDPSFSIAQLVSIFFGVLSMYMVYVIGTQLFNRWIALLGTFLTAINAVQIWFSTQAYAESLFAFLFYLLIWFYLKYPVKQGKHFSVIGIFLGLLYLTRLNGVFIFLAVVISYLFQERQLIVSRSRAVVVTACAGIIIATPWFVRNTIVFQNPFKTGGAYMNWVDSFEDMHSFHKQEPSPGKYIKKHSVSQILARYTRGLMRSFRGILLGNLQYSDPYPQGRFALLFICALLTALQKKPNRLLMFIYLSFIFHVLIVSWTLLGIFRYYIFFYPLMILWGLAGISTISSWLSRFFSGEKTRHTIKITLILVLVSIAVYPQIKPLSMILNYNDRSDYDQILETSRWIKANSSENDILIDFPVFIEFIFDYQRGTLIAPGGSIANLKKAAGIFGADLFILSHELLQLRPAYKRFWSTSVNGKISEHETLSFLKKVFESSGTRFMVYRIIN